MKTTRIFKIALALLAGFVLVFALSRRNKDQTQTELKITPIKAEDISDLVKSRNGKVTVVNFWATYCGPCVEEFPYFMKAREEFKSQGMELVFVSLDFQSEISEARKFLLEQRVDFETYIKNQGDGDFIKAVHPDWSGVIPITLIYDAQGKLAHFVGKALTFDELKEKIMSVLQSNK